VSLRDAIRTIGDEFQSPFGELKIGKRSAQSFTMLAIGGFSPLSGN